jgi:hypothetical protein
MRKAEDEYYLLRMLTYTSWGLLGTPVRKEQGVEGNMIQKLSVVDFKTSKGNRREHCESWLVFCLTAIAVAILVCNLKRCGAQKSYES